MVETPWTRAWLLEPPGAPPPSRVAVTARTAFSLLLPSLLDEFGWDRGLVAGAFSFGFLASAVGLGPSLTTVSVLALVGAAIGWALTKDAGRERKRTRQTRSSGSH